jgi:hypothetical protein
MVFGYRALRRIFGSNRVEVTSGWRRLHNEEQRKFYASPNIIRVIKIKEEKMGGTCRMGGRYEKCVQYFGWKT